MTTRIKLRRDTAANWLLANPILSAGEPGLETDTGKIKYGDGATVWASLSYGGGEASSLVSNTEVKVTTGDAERWLLRLRREEGYTGNWAGVFVQNVLYDTDGNVIVTTLVDLQSDGIAIFKFSPTGELIWKYAVGGFGWGAWPQGSAVIDNNNDIWCTLWPDDPGIGLMKISGTDGSVLYTSLIANADFGDAEASSMAVDSNNDVIIAGQWDSNLALLKVAGTAGTNNIGDIIWAKAFGSENNDWAHGYGVAVDYNNNIIVTGTATNEDDIDKLFVMVFDTDGNAQWQKNVELFQGASGAGASVAVDAVGNIYVTGTVVVPNANADVGPFNSLVSNAVMIVSLDSSGSVNWARKIGPGPCSWVGTGIAVGDDGDLYIIASTVQYKAGGDPGIGVWDPSIILARYDAQTGAVKWQKYWNNVDAQDAPAGPSDNEFGSLNNGGVWAGHAISVYKGRLLIGGSTRIGISDYDSWAFNNGNVSNFNQGFVAQLDIDANEFEQDGYKLVTSRVPGKLESGVFMSAGTMNANEIPTTAFIDGNFDGVPMENAGISVRKNSTKSNTWTFERNGDMQTPADTNVKLTQSQKGYFNMYGWWENDEDDVWYQTATRDEEGYVYTAGSNDYEDNTLYVSKFASSGERVWQWEYRCGTGANFYITWENNVYTLQYINSWGEGYKVGDIIKIHGGDLGGNTSNTISIRVDETIYNGSVYAASIVSTTPAPNGSGGSYVSDYYDDGEGEISSITVDPVTKNVVVSVVMNTANGDSTDWSWSVTELFFIDSDSGALLATKRLSDNGDVYGNAVTVNSNGVPVVVGEKYNEYKILSDGPVTPVSGSGVRSLFVAKSDFPEHFPGDAETNYGNCWITGSNITDQVQINEVNIYHEITSVTRQGSGVVVGISASGGSYSVSSLDNGGTNYLPGHKILVTGDLLGGATPANDAVLTVNTVDAGVVTAFNISGTPAGDGSWGSLSSLPNYQVGSGMTYTQHFMIDGSNDWMYINSYGSNYVLGDVLIVNGTQFAGGTTPASDFAITVTNVNGGAVTNFDYSNSHVPGNYLKLSTNTEVDFSAGSDYVVKLNLDGEAFVWTPSWEVAIGGSSNDKFYDVCTDSDNSIIAVGYGQYDVNYTQALAVKYNASGQLLWSKQLNYTSDWMENNGVVALSDDSVVVAGMSYYDGDYYTPTITKVNTDGDIVWQHVLRVSDDNYPDTPVSIAVDPVTDEVVVVFSAYTDDSRVNGQYAWHVVKFDSDGEVLWKRIIGTYDNDSYLDYEGNGAGNAVSISNGQYTIAGYTYATADDYYNAMLVTLPLDGTGTGKYGTFTYFEPNDDRIHLIRINNTSQSFTPTLNEGNMTATDNEKNFFNTHPYGEFNLFTETVLSEEGGAIEFADGSKQTFSATVVPQVRTYGNYTVRPEDSGKHILVKNNGWEIRIPSWQQVKLPVGFTLTIVNRSGGDIYLQVDDGEFLFSGGNDQTPYVGITDNGSGQMVTIMKIEEGEYVDDGDSHGDRWMIAGADIYNNW